MRCVLEVSQMLAVATPNGDFEEGDNSHWTGSDGLGGVGPANVLAGDPGGVGGSWYAQVNTLSPQWAYYGWDGATFTSDQTYVAKGYANGGTYLYFGDIAAGDYSPHTQTNPGVFCIEWTPSANRTAVRLVQNKNSAGPSPASSGELVIDNVQAATGRPSQREGAGVGTVVGTGDGALGPDENRYMVAGSALEHTLITTGGPYHMAEDVTFAPTGTVAATDVQAAIAEVASEATDEKAKVSANDTTPGYLNGKLVAGTNITLTENNDGGNETLTIAASGGGGSGGTDPKSAIYKPFTPAGVDDEFDDASFTGWTTVDGAGYTEVVTEDNDVCSVYVNGGGGIGRILAFMKATTVSAGDYIETAFRMNGVQQNYPLAGLVMADGVTVGSGTQVTWSMGHTGQGVPSLDWKRLTGYQTQASPAGVGALNSPAMTDAFLRLEYDAANTWRFWMSPDGLSWIDVSGAVSHTMTPTHVGFWVSTFGGTLPLVASFRYFRKGS